MSSALLGGLPVLTSLNQWQTTRNSCGCVCKFWWASKPNQIPKRLCAERHLKASERCSTDSIPVRAHLCMRLRCSRTYMPCIASFPQSDPAELMHSNECFICRNLRWKQLRKKTHSAKTVQRAARLCLIVLCHSPVLSNMP